MTLAALIIAIVANIAGAWSVNYQRRVCRWTRGRCTDPRPEPWHLRYRTAPPQVSHVNVETTGMAFLSALAERPQFLDELRRSIRRKA